MGYVALIADRGLIGKDLHLMKDIVVLLEGSYIADILSRADYEKSKAYYEGAGADYEGAGADYEGARPAQCRELHLGNRTLMPGLIECHNHLCIDAAQPCHLEHLSESSECELTLTALGGLKADLMSGVTTARCMGDRYYIDLKLKKMIEEGQVEGPRLVCAGIGMRGSHGAGYIGIPHNGPEEIRATCRKNLQMGADLLKLFVTPGVPAPESCFVPSFLSPEEISMAVREGSRLNIPTAAHCIGGQGLKDCIEGGVKVVEHMYMATDQDVKWLADSDCVVDLTSGIFLDPSREAFLSPSQAWAVGQNRPRVRENLRRLIDASIPFVLGTDGYHGFLYREAVFAVELGADRLTALKGVTSHAARVCGLENKTGSLEKGLLGDVIAVEGNPLEDTACLSKVTFVMKDGVVYKGGTRG